MCGIMGYVGKKNAVPVLLNGLKGLEYRGYDSAGLAVVNSQGDLEVVRRAGFLNELVQAVEKEGLESTMGIGHTRWATHGKPSEQNAHPHLDCQKKIAVVHNGIIENFLELKEGLIKKGHQFRSETDTEVIAHLVEENYQGDLLKAVQEAAKKLEGSFAIAAVSASEPDVIVTARKDSPLVVGRGEGEYFVASDIPALINYTKDVFILENGEMARLCPEGITLFNFDNKPIKKKIFKVAWSLQAAEKGGFADFMLKEIYEQPQAMRETLRGRTDSQGRVVLDELKISEESLKDINKVFIIACGTSYHAGLVAKVVLEEWAYLATEIEISSEFRYRDPIIDDKTLVVAITQSGETADTLAGLQRAKERQAKVIAVTNVVGSSAAREADGILYTRAGPEIGVAATKTLTAQMAAMYLLSLYLAQIRERVSLDEVAKTVALTKALPEQIEQVLEQAEEIKSCSAKFSGCENFLFLGRGSGLPVALEGALKLKEISYIHAEGYPAGEMKHGPIALINDGLPVVAVATLGRTYEKIIGNIEEVKARGAKVLAVATVGDEQIARLADQVFYIPQTEEFLSSAVAVVPLQLLAYYVAKKRGLNVDQPRNLAKSVTVE